ncbi:hypothetical protein [Flavobacterium sp.]|uniref:hypothetical protein n=1 Tax=Flavobacterium sp. TaxID=239 RepID=UPI0037518952
MITLQVALWASLIGLIISFIAIVKEKPLEECEHKNKFIYVDSVTVTCETTTVTCLDCGKKLKTETDCR